MYFHPNLCPAWGKPINPKGESATGRQPVQKLENQFMLKKVAGAVVAVVATTSLNAMAELPAAVGTAVTTAQTDGQELGYLMLGMAVVVGVVFWLKRKV